MNKPHISPQAGITLIELMVVVVIIGILASIAYPSYQDYVRAGARAEAEGILMENAQFLERNYTLNNCYHRTDTACASASNIALPFTQSPKTGTAKYSVTVNAASQTFTLSAAPTGTYSDAECGTLTLTQTSTKGENGTKDVAFCWKQ